ncbi:GltB/FmdC/FwdC-like GXGXG domain-containing protein [Desulfoscipio gibsoniae]
MNGLNVKFGYRDVFLGDLMSADMLYDARVITNGCRATIDARGLKHKELNDLLRETVLRGSTELVIDNVFGQRYIGTRLCLPQLDKKITIEINKFPGSDLGAFLNGHRIIVYGNAQDAVGNTMDAGKIVVHGRAGDVTAMSMRGGQIFIRDNAGYRTAIHMKEYRDKAPVLVVGGTAQDFLGEYMAGGMVLLLGLNLKDGEPHRAHYIGTGMHGGVIYLRGCLMENQLGKEVGVRPLDERDWEIVGRYVREYCNHFGGDANEILSDSFQKLIPVSLRPYGQIYAY